MAAISSSDKFKISWTGVFVLGGIITLFFATGSPDRTASILFPCPELLKVVATRSIDSSSTSFCLIFSSAVAVEDLINVFAFSISFFVASTAAITSDFACSFFTDLFT